MNIPFKMSRINPGAAKVWVLMIFLTAAGISSCEKTNELPDYSPPSDHTINKEGALHKSGLDQPLTNCVSCHGSDLRGGSSGVSCYECHGQEW